MAGTTADHLAKTLSQAGVKRVYGVVGDSLNGFTDALRRLQDYRLGAYAARRKAPPSRQAPRRT